MGVLTSFGLGPGSEEEITAGRRRTAAALALLSFALIAGAADANDWVKGGVEIDAGDGSQNSHLHWHVDLVRVGIERNLANFYVGQITSDAIYARTDYMNYITKQATYPGCTRGATDGTSGQPNWWCGLQVSQINAKMDATYGLLIFAAILNFVAWVLAQSINSGNVTVLSNPHAFKATTGLMAAACFFSFVAVCNFAGAGIKDGVCSGFDPVDPQNPSNNTYCDYSDGFRVAIFAVVFSLIQTVVMWFWVPHTGGSNYQFKTASDAEPTASAPTFSGSSGSGSAYQDIGNTAA